MKARALVVPLRFSCGVRKQVANIGTAHQVDAATVHRRGVPVVEHCGVQLSFRHHHANVGVLWDAVQLYPRRSLEAGRSPMAALLRALHPPFHILGGHPKLVQEGAAHPDGGGHLVLHDPHPLPLKVLRPLDACVRANDGPGVEEMVAVKDWQANPGIVATGQRYEVGRNRHL